LNMAPVLAQMHGDPLSTGFFRKQGGIDRIRNVGATRLPNRCDVVNVDA
jgi:hypothetical protein